MILPVTFIIDDKLGGVSSLNYNLICQAPAEAVVRIIHVNQTDLPYARGNMVYPVNAETRFNFDSCDNAYALARKLRNLIKHEKGALILNYGMEMGMLDHYPALQTTYQLVHDNYNFKLALKLGHIVDVFICHNSFIYKNLIEELPHRKDNIFLLPHGVCLPDYGQRLRDESGPLRLLFIGRHTYTKGLYDLPVISAILRERNIPVVWTCLGAGEETAAFRQAWSPEDSVSFITPPTNKEVIDICLKNEVFVLPTKFEGSPVSLLEAMSAGLVPVISRLPGGITDVVTPELGFLPEMDDNIAFADAIEWLYKNRCSVAEMGALCRKKIEQDFDVRNTSRRYFELFAEYDRYFRPKSIRKMKLGSRLDQPFIPSFVTRFIRNSFKVSGLLN